MLGENPDPDLRDFLTGWHAPLPNAEMHERILLACERESRQTKFVLPAAMFAATLLILTLIGGLTYEVRGYLKGKAAHGFKEQSHVGPLPKQEPIIVSREIQPLPKRPVTQKIHRKPDSQVYHHANRFYSLIDAPPPLGNGMLVRMKVPASTLQIAGIWTADGQMTDIEADVLIGEDGLARAIRFIGFE